MGFFFFQAEDGIRDVAVTGVQTCALPILSDFGIARAINAAGGDRLTQTGLAVGAPSYMSPEQAAGDRKSVVEGKSVDLGGRRIIKKKNKITRHKTVKRKDALRVETCNIST